MAKTRNTPYSNFRFLVNLNDGVGSDEPFAGFSEVSGLNAEITVAEYRAGNAKANHVSKVPGVFKTGDVTLKRGVMAADNLYKWLELARSGDFEAVKRTVTVSLLNEKGEPEPVLTWTLHDAMPLKWTGPQLSGKGGTDVAIEEFVLSVERVTQG